MANQVTNYKCPNCTGPLHFSIESGQLECDYCGASFAPGEIDKLNAKKQQAAAQAFEAEKESGKKKQPVPQEEGWSDTMRQYNCPSCGSQLICDETTAVICCPYCGNQGMVPGQFSGMDRPDYVIPFKLDKEAAVAALKEHCKGKPFLPKSFKAENQIKKLQGVYIPFWLFDATVKADCRFDGQDIVRRENKRDKTQHYDSRRSGTVRFERVPVDASSKMDDDLMDSLLPYKYKGLRPFSMAYFAGYLAERYDVSEADCAKRAEEQCSSSAVSYLAYDSQKTGKYNNIELEDAQVDFEQTGRTHVMLPVWLVSTQWRGKNYLFAMNGQTGKLVGDLPVAMGKYWAWTVGLTGLFSAIITVLLEIFA